MNAVAATLGLLPLQKDSAITAAREIRVWIGDAAMYPRQLSRIRVDRNGTVSGDAYFYWQKDPSEPDSTGTDGMIRRGWRGPCGPFATGAGYLACPAVFATERDWAAVLAAAEAAGLSDLPDERGRVVLDGWSILVELREGTAYRRYEYASPGPHVSPESGRALELARVFGVDVSQLRSRAVVPKYYGLARSGPHQSEFLPCGLAEVWARVHGESETNLDVQEQYMELEGDVTPRNQGSGYMRILYVSKVVGVGPWSPDACEGAPPPYLP